MYLNFWPADLISNMFKNDYIIYSPNPILRITQELREVTTTTSDQFSKALTTHLVPVVLKSGPLI